MTKITTRFCQSLLLLGILVEAAGPTFAAGTIVSVAFVGTGSGTYNGQPINGEFTGTFTYDQSLSVTQPLGTFSFIGSALTHTVSFTLPSVPQISDSGRYCEPYTILTSAGNKTALQLNATITTTGASTVTVFLPMVQPGSTIDQRHLPYSTVFPAPSPLPSPPATFTVGGTITFSGTITKLIPSEH